MNKYHWEQIDNIDADQVAELARALDLPPPGARYLVARGMADVDEVTRFLNPEPAHANDPFTFEHMGEAVELIRAAQAEGKSLLIHGDYDVDGISGTALLYHYFDGVFDPIYRFVPDRRKDGYGVATRAVDWAIDKEVGLVIAVDCGTSDGPLIARLEDAGIPVIVCDHHEFPVDGGARGIMLNPSRAGETYPFRSLCGTGVAYKLVEALYKSGIRGARKPQDLVDLMALATVGDLSPLVGENRYFVSAGLEAMNRSPRTGLKAMKGLARMGDRAIRAHHLSFVFAPRINAPGRIARPRPALEILCEPRKDEAFRLASLLEGQNERRRELTRVVQDAVTERIEEMPDRATRGAFVLAAPDWDEGVLGIAAARVVEDYGRPAILLNVSGDTAKGSGRSVPGIHLKETLDRFKDYFVRYGGHAQAVGLTMPSERVDAFAADMSAALADRPETRAGKGTLRIVGSLALDECSMDLLDFFGRCEPFGYGNAEPVWKISDLQVMDRTCLVGDGGHMKFFFQDTRGNPGEAICFNWTRDETPDDLHGRVIDLAATVQKGTYMGRVYPELRVRDVRFHGAS